MTIPKRLLLAEWKMKNFCLNPVKCSWSLHWSERSGTSGMTLKPKNLQIVPLQIFGSETLALTQKSANKLRTTQKAIRILEWRVRNSTRRRTIRDQMDWWPEIPCQKLSKEPRIGPIGMNWGRPMSNSGREWLYDDDGFWWHHFLIVPRTVCRN